MLLVLPVQEFGRSRLDAAAARAVDVRAAEIGLARQERRDLVEAVRTGLYDILAHPDLVKIWGSAWASEVERTESASPHTALVTIDFICVFIERFSLLYARSVGRSGSAALGLCLRSDRSIPAGRVR